MVAHGGGGNPYHGQGWVHLGFVPFEMLQLHILASAGPSVIQRAAQLLVEESKLEEFSIQNCPQPGSFLQQCEVKVFWTSWSPGMQHSKRDLLRIQGCGYHLATGKCWPDMLEERSSKKEVPLTKYWPTEVFVGYGRSGW